MCSSRKGAIAFLVRLVVFLLVLFGATEVWLRTATPATEVPIPYQDTEWKIKRFDAQAMTEGLWTVGRLAAHGGEWRINNAGWLSAVDYVPAAERDRPLVAMFGDSYIEGLLSDVDEHVDAFLATELDPPADVYAFGESGWYLAQAAAAARYASALFEPDLLVFFVDKGDVVDSIRENGVISADYWQISSSAEGFTEVPPEVIYSPSRVKLLLSRFAVVRYLRYNALVKLGGAGMTQEGAAGNEADATGASQATANDWQKPLPAADYLLATLNKDHPGVPVVFVAYGFENDRYLSVEQVTDTPLFADARAIEAACEGRHDCYFVDLRPAFAADWATNHRLFEAADGAHWNAYANRLVAQTVADFIEQNRLLPAEGMTPTD